MSLFKPRLHQQELIKFHEASKQLGTLTWHGMGLGKTAATLLIARNHLSRLRASGVKAPKFVVVLPKSAVPTWKVECHKVTPDLLSDMIIYPYSQLHHAIKSIKYYDCRMLVFDESHYLKAQGTTRLETLAEFFEKIHEMNQFKMGRILLLTGTTMPNSAHELYTSWAICCAPNLIEAAKRLRDETRFENWKMTFSQKKDVNWVIGKKRPKHLQKKGYAQKWEGAENVDKLTVILREFVHFKRVEDCIDLPEMQEIPIDLDLEDDKLLAEANIETPEAYMALVERLSRAKAPYMHDWVKEFITANNEQLVVFAMHRKPIEELQEKYPNQVRLITGAESGAARAQNLKDFQEGRYRILAMTYGSGAESLNLQNASFALYLGYPWNDAKLRQAMARIWRSGQLKKTFHYFLTSGQNDIRVLNLVLGKRAATQKVENSLIGKIEEDYKFPSSLDDLI